MQTRTHAHTRARAHTLEPLRLLDGVFEFMARADGADFVQKRKEWPDAELVDALECGVLQHRSWR